MANAKKGKKQGPMSEERKLKISIAKKESGYTHTAEAKANISRGRKGIRVSQQAKANQLKALADPEVRKKMGDATRGKIGHNSKPVQIYGVSYPSQGAAMKALSLPYKPFKKLLNSLT